MASAGRISEVLNEEPSQKMSESPMKPVLTGAVSFEKVSFTYAGAGNESLSDISFTLPAGTTAGIIGPTGSGKSTLVNLVPRLYDATKGDVRVDGVNVNDIDTRVLRDAIAIVPQKALLFTGTVADNLRWGNSEATDAELREAARAACAEEFVLGMDKGYDSMLSQGGVNLSGGQKQRLSLARALVRKPKILILDDCTSALDAQTESKVLRGIRSLDGKLTVLLISQRISTVMRCDTILCMDNGRLMGMGSHEELMKSCPTYKEIYASQIGGEDDGRH